MGAKLYKFHCTNDEQDYFIWAPEITTGYTTEGPNIKVWNTYGEYMAEFPTLTGVINCDPETSWFANSQYAADFSALGVPNVFSVASNTTYKFVAENGSYFTAKLHSYGYVILTFYKSDDTQVGSISGKDSKDAVSMISWCEGNANPSSGGRAADYAYYIEFSNGLAWHAVNYRNWTEWVLWSYWYVAEYPDSYMSAFWDGIPDIPSDTDPYSDIDGEGDIPGGGSVGIPGFPGLTATSTGIIGLFSPSSTQMQALADYMWTDFGGAGTDIVSVLKEIVDALKRAISNPLDYIIGLNIIPSQGLSIGGSSVIKFGFTSSGVSMPRLSNQYFTVDCGSISFPPLCGDTFLDYAPYSKFSIYLPYIGVKDVDANDFVGHTIGVVYHGDTVTGGVTAYITKDGSVMYQYSGCCALNIPLSADNWGNTISGSVQIATSLVTGAAMSGAAGVGMSAAKGAASVAANPSLLSPQVSHSGAVSGGAGCMAVQYPFVIRESVRFHSTAGFNKFSGYPSYYKRSLGAVSGFTTVFDVHLENVPATNGEIAEIENLLKSGVIL